MCTQTCISTVAKFLLKELEIIFVYVLDPSSIIKDIWKEDISKWSGSQQFHKDQKLNSMFCFYEIFLQLDNRYQKER